MNRILRLFGRRLVQTVPVVLGVVAINFLLLSLAPGDAVDTLAAGAAGSGDPAYLEELRRRYGLDEPLYQQLLNYFLQLLRFDLGYSIRANEPVTGLILSRLFPTLFLMASSIVFAVLVGALLGVLAARKRDGLADQLITLGTLVCYSMPSFWFGLMLVILFSVHLGWLPVGGFRSITPPDTLLGMAWDVLRHLVMPMLSLALIYIAIYTRLVRTSMLEVLNLDFIRSAYARGLSERQVLVRHALRNALLPTLTFVALQCSALLGGSVVVETVFAWPGLGSLAYDAVAQRDLNLLLGIIFISALLVSVVNIAVDLLYLFLDPRIESL